jgi:hypothetical protein
LHVNDKYAAKINIKNVTMYNNIEAFDRVPVNYRMVAKDNSSKKIYSCFSHTS